MLKQTGLTELICFLKKVDKLFPVPLSQKTYISSYAEKLLRQADLFIYEKDSKILGLAAGYIKNSVDNSAYISLVAVCPEVQRRNIGQKLVAEFIHSAEINNKKCVHLYAVRTNINAMKMYESLGFEEWYVENEARPDNVHLIYWLREK